MTKIIRAATNRENLVNATDTYEPSDVDARAREITHRAKRMMDEGQVQKGIDMLARLLQEQPMYADAYFTKAFGHRQAGALRPAIAEYDNILALPDRYASEDIKYMARAYRWAVDMETYSTDYIDVETLKSDAPKPLRRTRSADG